VKRIRAQNIPHLYLLKNLSDFREVRDCSPIHLLPTKLCRIIRE
jgi:hypothetical protein